MIDRSLEGQLSAAICGHLRMRLFCRIKGNSHCALLKALTLNPRFLEHMLEQRVGYLSQACGGILDRGVLDGAGQDFVLGRSPLVAEERLDDQVEHIAERHVTQKTAQ